MDGKVRGAGGVICKAREILALQVYNSIFTGQQDVKIVSTRKKLTVCFSDLVGFTELHREDGVGKDLTQLLNHYLTEMSKIALQYGATVDKYVGDAIVIFFGDPTTFWASSKMRWLACRWRWPCNSASENWPRNGAAAASTPRCAAGSAFTPVIARSAIRQRRSHGLHHGRWHREFRVAARARGAARRHTLSHSRPDAHVKDEIRCEERGQV